MKEKAANIQRKMNGFQRACRTTAQDHFKRITRKSDSYKEKHKETRSLRLCEFVTMILQDQRVNLNGIDFPTELFFLQYLKSRWKISVGFSREEPRRPSDNTAVKVPQVKFFLMRLWPQSLVPSLRNGNSHTSGWYHSGYINLFMFSWYWWRPFLRHSDFFGSARTSVFIHNLLSQYEIFWWKTALDTHWQTSTLAGFFYYYFTLGYTSPHLCIHLITQ